MNSRAFSRISIEALRWRHYNAAAVLIGDGSYVQIEGNAPSYTGCSPVPFAMSGVQVRGHRLVVRVVLLQTGCALLVASAFCAFRGLPAGLAALAGGLIVAFGSALFGWRMFAPGIAGAATLTAAMYTAVGLKWLWFVIALYVALARLKLQAAPLLAGLVAAQLGYFAGLLRRQR